MNTNTTKRYEIATDYEHNAEDWWEAVSAHGGGSFAGPINELLEHNRIEVSEIQRDQLLSHFARLPGWNDGPPHARHPVTVTEIE